MTHPLIRASSSESRSIWAFSKRRAMLFSARSAVVSSRTPDCRDGDINQCRCRSDRRRKERTLGFSLSTGP
jgi:hypothetical protein